MRRFLAPKINNVSELFPSAENVHDLIIYRFRGIHDDQVGVSSATTHDTLIKPQVSFPPILIFPQVFVNIRYVT